MASSFNLLPCHPLEASDALVAGIRLAAKANPEDLGTEANMKREKLLAVKSSAGDESSRIFGFHGGSLPCFIILTASFVAGDLHGRGGRGECATHDELPPAVQRQDSREGGLWRPLSPSVAAANGRCVVANWHCKVQFTSAPLAKCDSLTARLTRRRPLRSEAA